jgi:hypothetical protein
MSPADIADLPHATRGARGAKRTVILLCFASAAALICAGIASPAAGHEWQPAGLRSQDASSVFGSSARWRRSVAEALQADCNAGMAQVAWGSPRVGLTEDGPSDASAVRHEFAQWRLATIFRDCAELTRDVLSAANAQREIRAWIGLTRLLGDDQPLHNLIEMAGFPARSHDHAGAAGFAESEHRRRMRDILFEATLKLLDETD